MWYVACELSTDDPPEYNKLYAIPGGVLLGTYGYAASTNLFPDIHQATYLAASMCCVGALTGLSSQSTSRIGTIFTVHQITSKWKVIIKQIFFIDLKKNVLFNLRILYAG